MFVSRGARISPSGTAPPWKPSIQFALCFVFQAVLLAALIWPLGSLMWLIFLPPVHTLGVHVYLHGLFAMPRAVHLCILPVTLIMGIVSAIIFGVEFIYLPLSLLCLTVGIRLCSCCAQTSSERLEPSSSLRKEALSKLRKEAEALSHQRKTSPAVSPKDIQAAEERYLGHEAVWKALEGDGVKEGDGDGVKESEPVKESERPVRLVRLSWLLKLGDPKSSEHKEHKGVLPRRQKLPEDAFIGVEELREITRQAKRGVDFYSFYETAALELQLGEGNMLKRWFRTVFKIFSCEFVKRNVDDLLPIVAVS